MTFRDDLPRFLTAGDYELAREHIAELCAANGARPEDVGFFGSVNEPGVSDLDALLIGDAETLRRCQAAIERARADSEVLRETLWHPPLYVLDEAVESIRHLHTLEGLSDRVRDRLRPLDPTADRDALRLLLQVWWTFLLRAIADLRGQRGPSMRTALLLHKNLEVTRDRSRHLAGVAPAPGVAPSTQLRTAALDGSLTAAALRDAFGATLDEAATAVAGLDEALPLRDRSRRPFRIGRRTLVIARPAAGVVARSTGPRLITARPSSVALGHVFLGAPANDPATAQFVDVGRRTSRAYAANGLPDPFVRPFGLPPRT